MTTFLKVTFPLSLPGVVAGSLIVFTLSVSAYVTPAILSGGNETVMSMLIFQQYASVFNFPFGAALAVGLLVTTMILILLYLLAVERRKREPHERYDDASPAALDRRMAVLVGGRLAGAGL